MDALYEILTSLKKNKMRTILTGFSVAWGIFMLIVLLGAGNGLMNGIQSNFRDRANNVIRVYPGWTSKAYQGMKVGRRVRLTLDDVKYLKETFPDNISTAIPTARTWGRQVSVGSEYSVLRVMGIYPEYSEMEGIRVMAGKGRNINYQDIHDSRKVVTIHPKTADILFKGEEALGNYVKIQGVMFLVVGIYDAEEASDEQAAYIPFTTAQTLFNKGNFVDLINVQIEGLKSLEDNEAFNEEIRKALAVKKQFDPTDQNAIWLWNRFADYVQTQFIFSAIKIAIWVIGLFTLISGIVGVSNIMLISVRERTKEFGIRKAIGASPWSILRVVVLESVLITAIFGYIGMFLGIGVTELINYIMENAASQAGSDEMSIFKNPTVDIGIALGATITLVIAGTLAGFFPAKKAVMIKPVEALAAK